MSAPPTTPGPVSRREFARLAGCDEKQVRRALERGLLLANADGKLDTAQLTSAWRKPRRDTKPAPAAAADSSPAGADSGKAPSAPAARPDAGADAPPRTSAAGGALQQAVTRKEDFAGRLKELDYLERSGKLVDLETARRVVFDQNRAARDAWLNWPSKYAALIAADLGVEADRVAEVLAGYVHKQLVALGDPSGDFGKG